ncbi:MAG: hypothetical protein HYU71_14590 [Bacteroidetes bacterium]|nr:hypothetical protein [Bacteroidota bacterium]
MSIKASTPVHRFVSYALAYLIITLFSTLIWFYITKAVLIKLQSTPQKIREGYDNSFLSLIAVTSGFLLFATVLYRIIVFWALKLSSSMAIKIFVGIIAGISPVCLVQLFSFGLKLSDPGMLTEILIMAMAGGFIPIVQNQIKNMIA